MKTSRLLTLLPCLGLIGILHAETRTVNTAAGLFQALTDLNGNSANDVSVSIRNCLVNGSWPSGWTPKVAGDNLVGVKARFVGADDPDHPYAIRYASKARAAGLVSGWMATATDVRRDARYPRLRDGKVDIGCYQCWLDPVGFLMYVR